MQLSMGVGDSAVYLVQTRCSSGIWGPEVVSLDSAVVAFHVTEVGDIEYLVTGLVQSGEGLAPIFYSISPAGKVVDVFTEAPASTWFDLARAGLMAPTIPLSPKPVSKGESWSTTYYRGQGVYTCEGTGSLEGRTGYLVSLRASTVFEEEDASVGVTAEGKVVVSPERGWVEAGKGTVVLSYTGEPGSFSQTISYRMVSRR